MYFDVGWAAHPSRHMINERATFSKRQIGLLVARTFQNELIGIERDTRGSETTTNVIISAS